MSKNTGKKWTLWSIIIAVVLIAAVALGIVFGGFNGATSMDDAKTLTVTMNKLVYNTQLEKVEEICENEFGSLKYVAEKKGEMSGDDSEIVYVFDADADLAALEEALNAKFEAATNGGELNGSFISVTTNEEAVVSTLAKDVVLRGVIALAVFAVLAFAYVSLRYKLDMGIVAAICVVLSGALTAAIAMIVRIPVTASLVYVICVSALMTAVTVLLTFNKIRANAKAEEAISAEELVSSSVASKEICKLVWLTGGAIVLVGVVSGVASLISAGVLSTTFWFAVQAVVAVLVAWFMGVVYAPALYLPFKAAEDEKNEGKTKTDYQGAKKTSAKVKKVFAPKASAKKVELVEEEVKEEAEATVEEVAEETVEEAVEETVEEAVEETEDAPAEEVTEE